MAKRSKRSFRMGIGQISSFRGEVHKNIELVRAMVEKAQAEGVRHLVFPELTLTGYFTEPGFEQTALRIDGPEIAELCELSERMDLSIGFIEETSQALFFNSAIHCSQGDILSLHRKIYPPTYGRFDERRYFGAGWDVSAYNTPNGRMAMLICGDAWHLPIPYMAAHDGADILLILAASSREGLADTTPCEEAWKWMCQSYGLTLSCFVVFANLANGDPKYDFWGGSFIAGPDGNLIVQSQTNEPDLVIADLDLNTLRNQRVRLPFRRDDSLAHTVQLGKRVLRAKVKRDQLLTRNDLGLAPAPRPR